RSAGNGRPRQGRRRGNRGRYSPGERRGRTRRAGAARRGPTAQRLDVPSADFQSLHETSRASMDKRGGSRHSCRTGCRPFARTAENLMAKPAAMTPEQERARGAKILIVTGIVLIIALAGIVGLYVRLNAASRNIKPLATLPSSDVHALWTAPA